MTNMARPAYPKSGVAARGIASSRPSPGSVRVCVPYGGELARHRIITADGFDYVVATAAETARGRRAYITGAYPVQRGYLVMLRQPLYDVRSSDPSAAREQHEALVRVLAEAGVRVVRARRILAARQRAEQAEASRIAKRAHGESEPIAAR